MFLNYVFYASAAAFRKKESDALFFRKPLGKRAFTILKTITRCCDRCIIEEHTHAAMLGDLPICLYNDVKSITSQYKYFFGNRVIITLADGKIISR